MIDPVDDNADRGVIAGADIDSYRVGGVDQHAVASCAPPERNRFVDGGAGVRERLLHPQMVLRAAFARWAACRMAMAGSRS